MIKLTSARDTPMMVRASAILVVEGFDFGELSACPDHYGSRLTLASGQWSETIHAKEAPEVVIAAMNAEVSA